MFRAKKEEEQQKKERSSKAIAFYKNERLFQKLKTLDQKLEAVKNSPTMLRKVAPKEVKIGFANTCQRR